MLLSFDYKGGLANSNESLQDLAQKQVSHNQTLLESYTGLLIFPLAASACSQRPFDPSPDPFRGA